MLNIHRPRAQRVRELLALAVRQAEPNAPTHACPPLACRHRASASSTALPPAIARKNARGAKTAGSNFGRLHGGRAYDFDNANFGNITQTDMYKSGLSVSSVRGFFVG